MCSSMLIHGPIVRRGREGRVRLGLSEELRSASGPPAPSSHDGGRDDGIRGHVGVAAGDDVDPWSLHRRRVGDRFRSVRSPRDVARRARGASPLPRADAAGAPANGPGAWRDRPTPTPTSRATWSSRTTIQLPITCLQAENSKRDRAGTESVSRLLASSFGRAQGAACVRIASPRRGSALASTLLLQEARVGSHLPRPPPHHSTTTVMGFHPDPNSGENACFRFAYLRYSRPWRGSR